MGDGKIASDGCIFCSQITSSSEGEFARRRDMGKAVSAEGEKVRKHFRVIPAQEFLHSFCRETTGSRWRYERY